MLVAELDEVTYDLEVDGELVRRTLGRRVIERAGWATVMLAFTERSSAGEWKPAKLAVIRLQRARESWKRHATLTLRSDDAAALASFIAGSTALTAPGDGAASDTSPGDADE